MKVILTGGGTAGHAMANYTLIPLMLQRGWKCTYIGSRSGAEKRLITNQALVPYKEISSGKLRRYFSWRNFTDVFCVLRGIVESLGIMKKERPDVVFSGGGFVSVPVVLAARLLRIPVVVRETDYTVGLANRICLPFVHKVIVTFPDTLRDLEAKGVACEYHGLIVRPELLENPETMPTAVCLPAHQSKPVVLVMGGSLGSRRINREIRDSLPMLLKNYEIIHLCGKGNYRPDLATVPGYTQLEYTDQMALYYRSADVVITRCGSNAVSECLAQGKRTIYIPLPGSQSRGEQHQNGSYACIHGTALMLLEEELSGSALMTAVTAILNCQVNPSMVLTPSDLRSGCLQTISAIEAAAWTSIETQLKKGRIEARQISWNDLNAQEFQIYQELLDIVGE